MLNQFQRTPQQDRALLRQRECFFVSVPELRVAENIILRSEPISRSTWRNEWPNSSACRRKAAPAVNPML